MIRTWPKGEVTEALHLGGVLSWIPCWGSGSDPPEAKLGSLGQQPGLLGGEASSLLG